MHVTCTRCGHESGVTMPGVALQPLLDQLAYENPQTLAASLRPGETLLVLCRANVGGLAATDQRLLIVKDGQAHEFAYTDIESITIEKIGWFLDAYFELVTVGNRRREIKKAKEADAMANALSFIRPSLPMYEAAKARLLGIRDARKCSSCGAFVPLTEPEWQEAGRPELMQPIPNGGAGVLVTNLLPSERITFQAHGARYHKSMVVTDRRVLIVQGTREKSFHALEASAIDGVEADSAGIYLWIRGRPHRKPEGLARVTADNAIPADESDLPVMQRMAGVIAGLLGTPRT